MTYCEDAYDCAEGADALVIVHRMGAVPRARSRPAEAGDGRRPSMVDLRNIYPAEEMAQRGFIYESIGRSRPRVR